ncbi:MAG: AMP-binding protein [Nocardiopsaceae bacterium]|nr:AMP-binding protein [Nocardiopsaceae bacterium]
MPDRPLHALLLPPSAGGQLLAALAAGLDGTGPAILPLDPGLPRARLAALLDAFAPDAVVTPDGTRSRRPAGPGPGSQGGVPDATAVVIATSGSTGEPKGVRLTAGALLHSARASLARIGARTGGRWLCPLPVSHIAGLGVLVRSLAAGTDPVITGRLDPGRADPAALGCGYVSLVPTQLRRLLAAGADLASFDAILLGGAAIPPGLLARARAAGARVITTYGMSETCGGCVYDGTPLTGVTARPGPDGLIRISGPVLFAGYHRQPELTGRVLAGDGFRTADLGRVEADGRLTVLGRADDMINTGGEKVAPAQVAAVLETCPGVAEAAVIGQPDPEWGQRVTAVVVPADSAAPPELAVLRARVSEEIAGYAAPRSLVLTPALPLLPSGKPDPAALQALASPAT